LLKIFQKKKNLIYLEYRRKAEFIKLVYQMIHWNEYQLENKYLKKLSSRSKLGVVLMIIVCKTSIFLVCFFSSIFTTIACLDPNLNSNIFMTIFCTILLFFCTHYILSVVLIANLYSFLFTLYLKYRFQQIKDYIEIYSKTGKYIAINF
jgi:hypothetical protein